MGEFGDGEHGRRFRRAGRCGLEDRWNAWCLYLDGVNNEETMELLKARGNGKRNVLSPYPLISLTDTPFVLSS